jgi:hypothetical protein
MVARPVDEGTSVRPPAEPARTEAPRTTDTSQINGLLNRYRGAFNTLDAAAARSVWPTVDHRALDRAFAQLEQQEIAFDDCQIDVEGIRAAATCRGVARFVPKVGSRNSQAASRQWRFSLQKVDDGWIIDAVETR